ncbi:MAG: hypothetical protein ACYTAN_17105 [Planctomycetota bacterium]|jgi:hypothetical protein
MPELGKGFVFVTVLLFSFAFIISIVPAQFISSIDPSEYEYYDSVPDNWVGDQIAGWNEQFDDYGNATVLKDYVAHDLNIGGHDFEVSWWPDITLEDPLSFKHEVKWGIFTGYHFFNESPVSESTVQENIESADPQTSRLVMTCSNDEHAYTWYISVTYNSTKFTDLEEAYDGNVSYDPELRIFVGIGWNASVGTVNAWNVVGQLLAFRTPETGSVYINGLVGFSLWTCIIYLAYRLIIMAIPFLGGS